MKLTKRVEERNQVINHKEKGLTKRIGPYFNIPALASRWTGSNDQVTEMKLDLKPTEVGLVGLRLDQTLRGYRYLASRKSRECE